VGMRDSNKNIETSNKNISNERLKIDKHARKFTKEEYISSEVTGFILFDFILYENKKEMINGLKKLFSSSILNRKDLRTFNEIFDIKKEGILSGGGWLYLGTIHNKNLDFPFGEFVVNKNLPHFLDRIDVSVKQSVSFAYIVCYTCIIKKEYRKLSTKTLFIKSQDMKPYSFQGGFGQKIRGPKNDTSFDKVQIKTESFLKKYNSGIYLNRTNFNRIQCPNIKLIKINEIFPNNLKEWMDKHFNFLDFIDFSYSGFISQFFNEPCIVSLQNRSIRKKKGYSSGLTALFFKKNGEEEDISSIYHFQTFSTHDLSNLFLMIYWLNYQLEIVNTNFINRFDNYIKKFNLYIKNKDKKLPSFRKLYNDFKNIIALNTKYQLCHTKQLENIFEIKRIFKWVEVHKKNFSVIKTNSNHNKNIYDFFLEEVKTMSELLKNNSYIQSRYKLLFNYIKNLTRIKSINKNLFIQDEIKNISSNMLSHQEFYNNRLYLLTVIIVLLTICNVVLTLINLLN
jgi:hypothetical protein